MTKIRLNVLSLISIESKFLERVDYERLINDFTDINACRLIALEVFSLFL